LDYDELTAEKDKYSDEGFTQKIPDMSMYTTAGPPPQLPVQLRRGILNAESEDSSDPTLLPEPQHVLLNHLYALTVRDGVMCWVPHTDTRESMSPQCSTNPLLPDE